MKPNRAEGFDTVWGLGGDVPVDAGTEDPFARSRSCDHVSEPAGFDHDAAPDAGPRVVLLRESSGDRFFVERRSPSVRANFWRWRRHLAVRTVEGLTHLGRSAFGRGDPGSLLPRRPVPNVLGVAALELRHPVAVVVEAKAGHCAVGHRRVMRRFPSAASCST